MKRRTLFNIAIQNKSIHFEHHSIRPYSTSSDAGSASATFIFEDNESPEQLLDDISEEEFAIRSSYFFGAIKHPSQIKSETDGVLFNSAFHALLDRKFYQCLSRNNISTSDVLGWLKSPGSVPQDKLTVLKNCNEPRFNQIAAKYQANMPNIMKSIDQKYMSIAKASTHAIQSSDKDQDVKQKVNWARENVCRDEYYKLSKYDKSQANSQTARQKMDFYVDVQLYSQCLQAELCAKEILQCMTKGNNFQICMREPSVRVCVNKVNSMKLQ